VLLLYRGVRPILRARKNERKNLRAPPTERIA